MRSQCCVILPLILVLALTANAQPDPNVAPANEKLATDATQALNEVMGRLHGEMNAFEAVPADVWTNKNYYNKEVPVTMKQVCQVKKAVGQCLQEQVDLALDNLKSSNSFEVLLASIDFDTGFPRGKAQKDNVGHLLQSVSNSGHGLIVNLVGWLHKSHQPGKGQHYACSARALGFGNYAHSFYNGAYNVATGTADQLRKANEKMAASLNKDYTKSTCLEKIEQMCAQSSAIIV
jgi:hypothetical protein